MLVILGPSGHPTVTSVEKNNAESGLGRVIPAARRKLLRVTFNYSRRQLFANARIAAARVSAVAGTSRESTPGHAGLLWEPQGLVQMRVVEDIPEPSYGLPISPRLIGSHLLDRSQRKHENCVAAAF